MKLGRSGLRFVETYVWIAEGMQPYSVAAVRFWPGFQTQTIDGKSFIVVGDDFRDWPDPDSEILECGHEQPIRKWNGHKRFNARRVCRACASLCERTKTGQEPIPKQPFPAGTIDSTPT